MPPQHAPIRTPSRGTERDSDLRSSRHRERYGCSGCKFARPSGAGEVINLFPLAIRNGLTAEQIKQTIFAYPTGASDIGYML